VFLAETEKVEKETKKRERLKSNKT